MSQPSISLPNRYQGLRYAGLRGRPLTKIQVEILQLLCDGKLTKHIAATVHRSERAISQQRQKILSKTGCTSLVQLGVWAARRGLV